MVGDVEVCCSTDVIVAAMRSPSGASAILRAARHEGVALLFSVPLGMDYEAVCSEAEHRLAAVLGEHEVEIFLDSVLAISIFLR